MDKPETHDPVFLGLTRPAVIWGVPQPIFVLNAMFAMIGFLLLNAFWPLLIGGPIVHALAWTICRRDIQMFDLWRTKAHFLRCRNRAYWGANSYDPFL